jgi:hypothetical protein
MSKCSRDRANLWPLPLGNPSNSVRRQAQANALNAATLSGD